MDRVQVFLRSPLFTTREGTHVPRRAVILEGKVEETRGSGLVLAVTAWRNDLGEELEGKPATLFLPGTKIDHVWVLD